MRGLSGMLLIGRCVWRVLVVDAMDGTILNPFPPPGNSTDQGGGGPQSTQEVVP